MDKKNTIPSAFSQTLSCDGFSGNGQVLLFGGEWPMDAETRVYDLSDNTWTQKTPSVAPSARGVHAMASIASDQVLLFGGCDSAQNFGETWIYDLNDNTWTQKTLSPAPSPRCAHAMGSVADNRSVLFGGSVLGGLDGETWVYELVAEIHADIDIMFCGNPNSFNCKQKGVLPVTLFGSSDIDVSAMVFGSLKLCLASNPDNCVSAVDAEFPEDRGNPTIDLGTSECVDDLANPDGLADLDVLFVAREVATLINCSSLSKKAASPTLIMKGELSNGTPFVSTPVNDIGIDQLCMTKK
jgi:hypothetical protein